MRNVFKNKTTVWFIITILILSVAIGALNATKSETSFTENILQTIVTPVQKVITSSKNGIFGFFGYFSDKKKMHNEIDALKEENARLKEQIAKNETAHIENEELRKLLSLKSGNSVFELESAEVIARNPSNWYSTLTIDKGSAHGIALNQPVVTAGNALVGRISEVGTIWSRVSLITDPGHSAGAQITRSGEFGICEGDTINTASGSIRLSFVSKNANIIVGDTAITSGLGGVYPKGLIIGQVQKIRPDIQGISQYAVIKPDADFDKLRAVFVIKNAGE